MSPNLTWGFNGNDENHILGTVLGVDVGEGSDYSVKFTVQLNNNGVKFVEKIKEFERNLTYAPGGVIKEREGNLIKKFDLTSVSLIRKIKDENKRTT